MKEKTDTCLKLILDSEPIIIPTDTVYGLVCRYDSKAAVNKIYKLKGRDRNKPLILLGYDWKALKRFVRLQDLPKKTCQGMSQRIKEEWPGALTIILPSSKKVPNFLNKGFKTIGLRVPNNEFALNLLKNCPGKVLASTSANLSGKSPKYPQKEILKKIKLFVKAKKGEMSLNPSRIIEYSKKTITVIR